MKTKFYILSLAAAAFCLAGCEEEFFKDKGTAVKVTADATTVYTGETVNFKLDGNADFITFWSGEVGNDYAHSTAENSRKIYGCKPQFSFAVTYSNEGIQWRNQIFEQDVTKKPLRMMYSTDFDGDYSIEGIERATWTELTSRVSWPASASATYLVAPATPTFGPSNYYDFIPAAKDSTPVWIAFRYHIDAYVDSLKNERSPMAIHTFQTVNYDPNDSDHSEIKFNYANVGWRFITEGYKKNEATDETYGMISGAYMRLSGYPCVAKDSTDKQFNPAERVCWAVSRKLIVNSQIDDGCDVGLAIKNRTDVAINSYSYSFNQVGEYDVHFTYSNSASSLGGKTSYSSGDTSVRIKVIDRGSSSINDPEIKKW